MHKIMPCLLLAVMFASAAWLYVNVIELIGVLMK